MVIAVMTGHLVMDRCSVHLACDFASDGSAWWRQVILQQSNALLAYLAMLARMAAALTFHPELIACCAGI